MFVKRIIVIMLVISGLFIVNNLSAQDVGPDGFFRYSYPIEMPPGINGMQPSITEFND